MMRVEQNECPAEESVDQRGGGVFVAASRHAPRATANRTDLTHEEAGP